MRLSMPITILEDNKAAIDWSVKLTHSARMKHVEKSLYWIRQFVSQRKIQLQHVRSEDQLADLGTKPLPVSAFRRLDNKLKQMQKKYRRLVGSFIFICYTCRPDVVYATNMLCRWMANPGWKHYKAAIHLLKYLIGSKRAGIKYFRSGNLYIIIFEIGRAHV